ncbi:sulfotransferase family protein [Dyella lutea]|uniref:Sulfotransferase n=1 Tax=Dyella lutea TaxID=2950441 RepID=A0ABT1F7Q3_9GAMM|nr:sulfotransferase [Dyella lutea]MCP1373424.1 sulfotransferase [Dyella lutea]
MSESSTAILVLGMHRSGTSALTRVLNLLGAHVGDDLLAAKADNARGFWEHAEAVAIHDRLLTALGMSWHDPRELPAGWLASSAGRTAAGEVARLIERDMKGKRLWAVKDPRMCRLAPLWIEALRSLGIGAKAVLAVRDPYEVASSLHVRDGWSHQHTYLMWAEHLLEALRATADIPRALVSYEQLLGNWRMHIGRLADQLGISWDPGPEHAGPAIEAFLTPDERHHDVSHSGLDVQFGYVPPTFLKRLHAACVETSLDANWRRLDEFDRQFSAVAEVFAGPMDEVTTSRDKAAQVGLEQGHLAQERLERIHQLQVELEEAVRNQANLQTLAVERIERIHQLDAALATATTERGAFEALSAERIERIHQLQADLARLQHVELDLASRTSEMHSVRDQLKDLSNLAGSRWWALKRVVRPLRPSQSLSAPVKG